MSVNEWAQQLFGPEPPPAAPAGQAAFARFKRVTTGQNVAASLRRQRDGQIAGFPRMPNRREHVALVLHQPSYWYGACGAWSCDFLGPARSREEQARAHVEAHRTRAAAESP